MSFVDREYGGPKVVPSPRRHRLTDSEVRRLRSAQMYAQKLKGWTSDRIGLYFGFTRRHVNREIASLPPGTRATIEGKYRRGEISVA